MHGLTIVAMAVKLRDGFSRHLDPYSSPAALNLNHLGIPIVLRTVIVAKKSGV